MLTPCVGRRCACAPIFWGWLLPTNLHDPMYPMYLSMCLTLDAIMGNFPQIQWSFLEGPKVTRLVSFASPPVAPESARSETRAPDPAPIRIPGVPGPLSVSHVLLKAANDSDLWEGNRATRLAVAVHFAIVTAAGSAVTSSLQNCGKIGGKLRTLPPPPDTDPAPTDTRSTPRGHQRGSS